MVDQVRTTIEERIALGATLDEIERLVRMSRGLRPEEREALWRWAWSYVPAPPPTATLH